MSITHLQREDTSQVFGCVGHIRPALWPRGCNCKHDWPQVDVLGCQIYRFLALPCRCSRSDTSAPPVDTPHPTSYTQGWQTPPAVVPLVPTVGSRLFNFPGPQAVPLEARYTQKRWPLRLLSRSEFSGKAMLFFKSISELSPKGPVLLYLKYTAGGPKSK